MSVDIAQLLAFSVKNNASDLHLSAGVPPMIRVDGDVSGTEGDFPARFDLLFALTDPSGNEGNIELKRVGAGEYDFGGGARLDTFTRTPAIRTWQIRQLLFRFHHDAIKRTLGFAFRLPLSEERNVEQGRIKSVRAGLGSESRMTAAKLSRAGTRQTCKSGCEERSSLECGVLHRQSIP